MTGLNAAAVIVRNLPSAMTEAFLNSLFAQACNEGRIEHVVLKDKTRRNGH
jgi:hypothetical protein